MYGRGFCLGNIFCVCFVCNTENIDDSIVLGIYLSAVRVKLRCITAVDANVMKATWKFGLQKKPEQQK